MTRGYRRNPNDTCEKALLVRERKILCRLIQRAEPHKNRK